MGRLHGGGGVSTEDAVQTGAKRRLEALEPFGTVIVFAGDMSKMALGDVVSRRSNICITPHSPRACRAESADLSHWPAIGQCQTLGLLTPCPVLGQAICAHLCSRVQLLWRWCGLVHCNSAPSDSTPRANDTPTPAMLTSIQPPYHSNGPPGQPRDHYRILLQTVSSGWSRPPDDATGPDLVKTNQDRTRHD